MQPEYYRTWRKIIHILDQVLTQKVDICWAIGIIRQMTAIARLQGVLSGKEVLSIQYLVNGIEVKLNKGAIDQLEKTREFLMQQGTVLEDLCPLTYETEVKNTSFGREVEVFKVKELKVHHLANYEDADLFDENLLRCLCDSPVAAAVPNFPSFDHISGNEIYCPSEEELRDPQWRKSHHVMLVVGDGVENGISFWELQESAGLARGVDGFIRIRKSQLIVSHFVEIEGPIFRQLQMDYLSTCTPAHGDDVRMVDGSGSSSTPLGDDVMMTDCSGSTPPRDDDTMDFGSI